MLIKCLDRISVYSISIEMYENKRNNERKQIIINYLEISNLQEL
jgi:hypothetical protein